jgi:hypothetical protein
LRKAVGNVVSAEGEVSTSAEEKANVLFKTFSSIYRVDEGTDSIPQQRDDVSIMPDFTIQPDEVHREVSGLLPTKSPGPDGIHPAILKPLAGILAKPLSALFNASLMRASLPRDWKMAAITPIHKGGSRAVALNYRPVSLTSVVLKILERIIAANIVQHVAVNHLLSAEQHGFVKKKSCLTNLISFLDEITKRLDKGEPVEVWYLDFQKAFDSVNHRLLMRKLTTFNLSKIVLDWISQFLTGRTFYVSVECHHSRTGLPTSGVPQGSVLGPLLFLMYVNDLTSELENPCYMFADDVKIVGTPTDPSVQRDLDRIQKWTTAWELPLNASKCQHLMSTNSSATIRYLGESSNPTALSMVEHVRDLGIEITHNFQPSAQCQAAAKKASGALYQLRRTITSRDPEVLLPLF